MEAKPASSPAFWPIVGVPIPVGRTPASPMPCRRKVMSWACGGVAAASPGHAQSGGEGMVVGAAADLAVVAAVEVDALRDARLGREAERRGIALRRGAEHGEGIARRAGERGRDRPARVGMLVHPAKT